MSCYQWRETGDCKFGDDCRFVRFHRDCSFWNDGRCTYGDNCRFFHAKEQNDQSDDDYNDGASICSVPTSALSLHSSQSDDYFSETASLSSVATSALSLYPTDHAIERMLERGVTIREMKATKKYGKEQVVGKKNRKLTVGQPHRAL